MTPFTYAFPRPAVSVDIVLFALETEQLCVLLIQRGKPPFLNQWALPGGFVDMDETLYEAALRELREETGVDGISLEQFRAYGDPGRDPRGRVISVVFYAFLAQKQSVEIEGGDDAANARWFAIEDLPDLAFDHADILSDSLREFRFTFENSAIGYDHLPEVFNRSQLKKLFKGVLGKSDITPEYIQRLMKKGIIETVKQKESSRQNEEEWFRFQNQAIEDLARFRYNQ